MTRRNSQKEAGGNPRYRAYDFEGNQMHLHPSRGQVDTALLPMYDFWQEQLEGALPVARRKLDPVELPLDVLPWMFMARIVDGGDDFEYTLVGTGLTEMLGRDMTGRRFSTIDYPPDHQRFLQHRLQTVINEVAPVLSRGRAAWVKKEHILIATLLLPGSSDGERVDYVFGTTIRRYAEPEEDT